MMIEGQSLATSRGFSECSTYPCGIHARPIPRPDPFLVLDQRLAVAVAVLAEVPPVDEKPVQPAAGAAELNANIAPVLEWQVFRQAETNFARRQDVEHLSAIALPHLTWPQKRKHGASGRSDGAYPIRAMPCRVDSRRERSGRQA